MERLEALRSDALKHKLNLDDFFYKFYKKYDALKELPKTERYAESFYSAFSNVTPVILDGELVVGRCGNTLSSAEQAEYQEKYKSIWQETIAPMNCGQDSHMAIDYKLLLESGISGIIEKIDGYLKTCDKGQIPFYKVCRRCLEAVVKYSENYADYAAKLAESETDSARRAELIKISDICKKVPKHPAQSFYEAVQSVHFITHCISLNPYRPWSQQFQLGHPDRYLLPYYEKDIIDGAITKEYAQLLLDCLGIQINIRVPHGLSSGYMVGGRDADGNIVSNELTEMCMQVIDDIRLVYPSVGLCVTEGMDDRYLEKACEILSHGRSHPAIFNDDVITKGLMYYGVPEREAHSYIHSTCVEITPVGSSNVWVASPYRNMAQVLLDAMDREYESLDGFIGRIYEITDGLIKRGYETFTANRQKRSEHSMNPLLSCFVNDCLNRGIDIEQGGAKYNWILPSFVGMANLVDSIYVIKTLVFDSKEYTMKELKEIVDSDFTGNEELRRRILTSIPKYGNDNDDIDKYFEMFINHITKECEKYKSIHSNANIIPSVFCWIKHEYFGRMTGATPDGRSAGFPLGDGSGPCQGREMNGPTASVLSSTKWDHSKLIGGVAVNMKFSKSSLGQGSTATMKGIIKTYLARGGFEMQINVIDKATLERAVLTPEEYSDLVVRIGGYSDYFVKLSTEMQKEVILRTEHAI